MTPVFVYYNYYKVLLKKELLLVKIIFIVRLHWCVLYNLRTCESLLSLIEMAYFVIYTFTWIVNSLISKSINSIVSVYHNQNAIHKQDVNSPCALTSNICFMC